MTKEYLKFEMPNSATNADFNLIQSCFSSFEIRHYFVIRCFVIRHFR
jgi:hypothetical protein